MPRNTATVIRDELFALESELHDSLHRLLADVDYWFLPEDWIAKHASIESFAIDQAGELKVVFRVVEKINVYDRELKELVGIDLTNEDLTRIRALVNQIHLLRKLHESKSPLDKLLANRVSV